ncbi:MAG TPA: UDP-3-O-(3-hydroxymyristoyl)glucosamine N-acyltransferase [Candidatus Polarisedimenticolia bacterium]|jgi:UDP-3-O-[3-hydroxymyristoyl] glucosamine N-acyltransferase
MSAGRGRTLGDLARSLSGRVEGDPALVVEGIAPLDTAGPRDLSFLANPRYLPRARATGAGAVMVGPDVSLPGRNLLVVADPYLALASLLELFHPPRRPEPGIHPSAHIGANCAFGRDVSVQPGAVIGEGCRLGERAVVMPGAVLGVRVAVGDATTIHPNVTIYDGCVIGSRVIIHAGSVIGSDGFGFAREGTRHRKIPQIGNVVVEDDVEIGAGVTVDRGTFGSTVIGRGTKIDNLVQIGHNVAIGEDSILVAQSGISGSTRLGRSVTFAGQSGAVGHIEIGDGAVVGAKSAVTHDLPAGAFVIGHPAIDARIWKRAAAIFARLPDLRRRLLRLEGSRETEDKEV